MKHLFTCILLASSIFTFGQNVGIGTKTPQAKLHVVDSTSSVDVQIQTNNPNSNATLRLVNGNSALAIEKRNSGEAYANNIESFGGDLFLGTSTSNSLKIVTKGIERIRIDSNGSVGIGNTAPNINSILDLSNNNGKGLYLPQVTDVQMATFSSAPDGIIVYNTTEKGLFLRKSGQWVQANFSLPYKGDFDIADTLLNITNSSVVASFKNNNEFETGPTLYVSGKQSSLPNGVIYATNSRSTISSGNAVIRADSHLSTGVLGTSDSSYGVMGITTASVGVLGLSLFGGDNSYGVWGEGISRGSVGVLAKNNSGIAMIAKTTAASGYPFQVIGVDTAKMMLASTGAFGPSMMEFVSDKDQPSQWRPGYIISADSGQFTGRLDFYTNGSGIGNKYGSVAAMSLKNGQVGFGINNPHYITHIYKDADVWHTGIGGSTGQLLIGGQTANGAVIQSVTTNGSGARDLYLQRDGGKVGIGTNNPGAQLEIKGVSSLTTPNFLINQSNTDYARQTFQNSNGKSFTLAAVNGGAIADVLNIYSEKLSQNLISISSDSKQNITLNGSTVLGSILFHPSVNPVPISLFIPNVTTEGISVLRYEVNGYDLSIGGFTGGVEGRILIVEMTGTGTLTFKDYNSSSSPENQLYLPKNGILSRDITIDDQHIVQFIYLGGHWKVMAKS